MSDFISRSGMFDPHSRIFAASRTRRDWRGMLAVLSTALVLALAMAIGSASPAYAQSGGSVTLSTKSVPAPQGALGLCQRYAWACARTAGKAAMSTAQKLALAEEVNRSVNGRVRQISDQLQYRRAEHWALPTARGGDCEDFALLKKRELVGRGVPAERLLIATVLDRKRQPHAVLVLSTGQGDYVLDNLTSRIKPWNRTGYSFLRMQDPRAPERWVGVFAGGIFRDTGTASLTR